MRSTSREPRPKKPEAIAPTINKAENRSNHGQIAIKKSKSKSRSKGKSGGGFHTFGFGRASVCRGGRRGEISSLRGALDEEKSIRVDGARYQVGPMRFSINRPAVVVPSIPCFQGVFGDHTADTDDCTAHTRFFRGLVFTQRRSLVDTDGPRRRGLGKWV
ncbi:hypothetical protein BHE74_00030016 [Ensete ventricosum]|nr:hypothetical protein GW17_00046403 [Ensete ventricosum]RWW62833.1 hypothetical protein BHE74_00030016 [Ensete ventricosum]